MKEVFRLQTDFSSSFDRWVSSFVSDHPAQLEWTTLKELIHEYTTSHTNDTLPAYISSAFNILRPTRFNYKQFRDCYF